MGGLCGVFGIQRHRPHANQDEVVRLVVSIADGTLTDIDKIAEQLAAWNKPTGICAQTTYRRMTAVTVPGLWWAQGW
jgi:hypothetical protein